MHNRLPAINKEIIEKDIQIAVRVAPKKKQPPRAPNSANKDRPTKVKNYRNEKTRLCHLR